MLNKNQGSIGARVRLPFQQGNPRLAEGDRKTERHLSATSVRSLESGQCKPLQQLVAPVGVGKERLERVRDERARGAVRTSVTEDMADRFQAHNQPDCRRRCALARPYLAARRNQGSGRDAGLRRAQSSDFGELSRATSASSVESLGGVGSRPTRRGVGHVHSSLSAHSPGITPLNRPSVFA
jgi:hypothetical protein